MTPSPEKLTELRRELESQEQQLSVLVRSLDSDQLERIARLSDHVLDQLDTVVGNLQRAPRPAAPLFGLRA